MMLFYLPNNAIALENNVVTSNLNVSESNSLAQSDAIDAYFVLRNTFVLDENGEIIDYPDSYGGCYINDDNQLVICGKNGDFSFISSCQNIIDENNLPVIYQSCNVSLKEAIKQYYKLSDYLTDDSIIENSFYSSEKNSYIIQIDTEHEQVLSEALYRLYSNADCKSINTSISIEYVETESLSVKKSEVESKVEDISNIAASSNYPLIAGTPLYSNYPNSRTYMQCGTLGISGSIGGMNNFILTAGHVADNSPCLYKNGVYTQLLTHSIQVGSDRLGDFGILYTTSSLYYSTNLTYVDKGQTTSTIAYYYNHSDYPEGATLCKYGISTGYTEGKVAGTSYIEYQNGFENLEIKGIISVKSTEGPLSAPGDSGGPVWAKAKNGSKILMGVVSGSNYSQGYYYMYVSPLYLATSQGFTPYNMIAVDFYAQ